MRSVRVPSAGSHLPDDAQRVTTIPFRQRVLTSQPFSSGDVTTDFVEHFLAEEQTAAAVS